MSDTPGRRGMSVRTARTVEYSIVGISIVALVLIFQPFALSLFTVGAGLIVLVGLLFNLVPLAQPGRSVGSLVRGGVIIVVAFLVVTALALGSAELYAMYLTGK